MFCSLVLEVFEQVDHNNEALAVDSFNVYLVWVTGESGRSARNGVFRVALVGVAELYEVHVDSKALHHLGDGVAMNVVLCRCVGRLGVKFVLR